MKIRHTFTIAASLLLLSCTISSEDPNHTGTTGVQQSNSHSSVSKLTKEERNEVKQQIERDINSAFYSGLGSVFLKNNGRRVAVNDHSTYCVKNGETVWVHYFDISAQDHNTSYDDSYDHTITIYEETEGFVSSVTFKEGYPDQTVMDKFCSKW
jgi:hypothetical protein